MKQFNKSTTKGSLPLEPSGEEKAFVYQQALELTPLLINSNNKEPIAVILKKNQDTTKKSKYSVTFILIPNTLNLRIQCEGENLFDVCMDAKNKAKKTIIHLMNQSNQPIRDFQLKHFKKFPYMH